MEATAPLGRPRRDIHRVAGAAIAALALAALLAMNHSDRYVPAISDWYLQMALPYTPGAVHEFTPTFDDERAFYACVRLVAKRIGDRGSIVTFAGSGAAATLALGDGRYQVRSYVDESMVMGTTQRHAFTCLVRAERERWIVEELNVQEVGLPAGLATTAR